MDQVYEWVDMNAGWAASVGERTIMKWIRLSAHWKHMWYILLWAMLQLANMLNLARTDFFGSKNAPKSDPCAKGASPPKLGLCGRLRPLAFTIKNKPSSHDPCG